MEEFLDTVGDSLRNAVAAMLAAIPNILGFLLIVIIGWIISGLLAGAVAAILRAVRFNELAQRSGITDFTQRMGAKTDPAGVLAGIVKWFVRLLTLIVAFDALGLPAVSQVINSFLLWLPNLVVALVILVIAGLIANALSDLVRGAASKAGFTNADLLANITRIAIWAFAVVVAVNQIGVASTIVNTLFMALVGALALAVGLAFGLGGRDTAGQIVQGWYRQRHEAAQRLQDAAQAARQQPPQAGGRPVQSDTIVIAPEPMTPPSGELPGQPPQGGRSAGS